MADNETIADVIAAMRDEAARADMEQEYSIDDAAEMMREFAWRFEEAHKREAVTDCNQFGDAAKLRKAVVETQSVIAKCIDILNKIPDSCGYDGLIDDVADELCSLREEHIKAALAAPPRNCDRFASAYEAWDAFDEWADSYRSQGKTEPFNEVGWLFAPATNKKGENNGR